MPPNSTHTVDYLVSVTRELVHHVRPAYLIAGLGAWLAWKILYRLVLWPRFLSPLRAFPGPPLGGLITGQFPAIIYSEAGIPQREWVKKYGSAVRVVGPVGIERLIFTKADTLHKILVNDWMEYPRPAFMREILGLVAGYGLLTVTGNDHKQMRKAMNPAFSIPNLMAQTDMYYGPIDSLIEILNEQIDGETIPSDGKVLLMYDWMSKVTLDIICDTAFGYKTDSLRNPHNELASAYENLLNTQTGPNSARFVAVASLPGFKRAVNSRWAYNHRSWLMKASILGPLGVVIDSMHRIKKISAQMLEEKLQESAVAISDTDAKRDIMTLLVRARKADMEKEKSGYAMTDQQMIDQVLTFLGAGHETTASGLAWTLWLLANDKKSQDELRKEVKPLFESDAKPNYRTLKDLPWLDGVVMESLRLLPPVPMTFRQAAKTDYIEGVEVPKGTILYIPIRVVNTWKEIWGENAEEFYPPRWQNLPKEYTPTLSFLSFLAGPHACIGKTMAIMEMKAVIAALISHFEFEPAYEGQVPQPTAAVTMKPADNMPLRVKKVQ